MAIQLIRLSQIKANLAEFVDFEQQLISMFGDDNTERFVAEEGQKTFTLTNEYLIGRNSLKVFVNGILQNCGQYEGYIEMNSKMISFTEPLAKDDNVVVVRNALSLYGNRMGRERVKAYDIIKGTNFITDKNSTQVIFDAPEKYQPGLNQLKVFVNGVLQICGSAFDYTEINENQFKMNYNLEVGAIVTSEVTAGGLRVYKCDRYPIFIDTNKATQRDFVLPTAYKPGKNNLKVYINGVLLRKGVDNDYVEVSPYAFRMNMDLTVGSILEAEITTFTVDVFTITREQIIITAENKVNMTFTTKIPYTLGESNLNVYANGIFLREGLNEDYVEVDPNTFKINFDTLEIGSVVEYEIITW